MIISYILTSSIIILILLYLMRWLITRGVHLLQWQGILCSMNVLSLMREVWWLNIIIRLLLNRVPAMIRRRTTRVTRIMRMLRVISLIRVPLVFIRILSISTPWSRVISYSLRWSVVVHIYCKRMDLQIFYHKRKLLINYYYYYKKTVFSLVIQKENFELQQLEYSETRKDQLKRKINSG